MSHPVCSLALLATVSTTAACVGPAKIIGQLDGGEFETSEGETTEGETSSGETDGMEEDTGEPTGTCASAIGDLEQQISDAEAEGRSCAVVIRATFEDAEFIGYLISCSEPQPDLSLAEAQMMATWPGQDQSKTEDAYVLYTPPGDFGGVSYVSKRSGLVFEGGIVWDGAGDINVPVELDSIAELGTGCKEDQPDIAVELWPYDFIMGGEGLVEEADPVINALWDLAPFYVAGPGTTISVLAYPRSVGAFDPASAEIIVIIDYA